MSLSLALPNPLRTPFSRWAPVMVEELAAYNVPIPPADETDWLPWATQVYALPELLDAGCPNPHEFSSWQSWGSALLQVTG